MRERELLVALACLAVAGEARAAGSSVRGSRHDFSVTGPGPFRATSERSACIFCHAMHGAGPNLTNRPDATAAHRPYDSSTAKNKPSAPTGASRVCLSCHDGTIAVGATRAGRIQMSGPDLIPAGHAANLGTDLRGTHPVSFRPTSSAGVHAPRQGDAVRLDPNGEIQCTTCHDPHEEWRDPVNGKFLVKPNAGSNLCLSCHETIAVAAAASSHALSPARMASPVQKTALATASGPARSSTTVGEAGCAACHTSHGADARGRLLRAVRTDDETCLSCHGAGPAKKLLAADLAKPWSHSSEGRPGHDPVERLGRGLYGRARAVAADRRHVTCADCHNSHAASSRRATAPAASGPLEGVWGIGLNGERVESVKFEYEICFKCHGDTAPPIQSVLGIGTDVRRALSDTNLRNVFSPTSPSFHPVAAPGRNADVPSLRAPYTAASLIYCSDCHASDQAATFSSTSLADGPVARGPHGSIYPHLLERQYQSADPAPESPASYALCYKCHDRDVLLSSRSAFPLHRLHVVDRTTACATCHVAHGVSSQAGTTRENAHLVSFNTRVVTAGKTGRAGYASEGGRHGSCNLTCHGSTHDGLRYRY